MSGWKWRERNFRYLGVRSDFLKVIVMVLWLLFDVSWGLKSRGVNWVQVFLGLDRVVKLLLLVALDHQVVFEPALWIGRHQELLWLGSIELGEWSCAMALCFGFTDSLRESGGLFLWEHSCKLQKSYFTAHLLPGNTFQMGFAWVEIHAQILRLYAEVGVLWSLTEGHTLLRTAELRVQL